MSARARWAALACASCLVATTAAASNVRDRHGDVEIAMDVAPPARVCFTWPADRFDEKACAGLKVRPLDAPFAVPPGGTPIVAAIVRVEVPDDEARAAMSVVRVPKELPPFRQGGEQELARGMVEAARADTSLPGRLREGFDAKIVPIGANEAVRIVLERDVPPESTAHYAEHRVVYVVRVPGGAYLVDWSCRREHAQTIDDVAATAMKTIEIVRTHDETTRARPRSFVAEHGATIGVVAVVVALGAFAAVRWRRPPPTKTKKRRTRDRRTEDVR